MQKFVSVLDWDRYEDARDAEAKFQVIMDAACSLCKPDCLPDNYKILEFYNVVADQYRYTGGMTSFKTGLDLQAIQAAFELLGIDQEERQEILPGVLFFSRKIVEIENKKLSAEIEKGKKNAR